jgi:hypothetical protein
MDLNINIIDYVPLGNDLFWKNWDTPWKDCSTSWKDLTDPTPHEVVFFFLETDLNITILAEATDVDSECDIANFDGATSLTGAVPARAQSFLSQGGELVSMSFYLSKKGLVSGTIEARIYDAEGVYGTTNIPSGTPLATSTPVSVSTLDTEYDGTVDSVKEVSFDFSSTVFNLTPGNYYCAVIYYTP